MRDSTDIATAISAVNNIVTEQNVALSALKTTLEGKAAGGRSMKWYDVASVVTTEETNIISVSQDAEGREISGYHAVAIVMSFVLPADSTQTSATGTIVLKPTASTASENNAYRILLQLTSWKTMLRSSNAFFMGDAKALFGSGVNAQTAGNVPDTGWTGAVMDGVSMQIQISGDHFPVGTKVNVAVLSEGYKA